MADGKCLGVILGNRGFFPDELVREGRKKLLALLKKQGYSVVVLDEKDTKFGSVETWEDAKKCAALFQERRADIDGVLVTLPNFGDERGVADSLRLSNLQVPVLVHAWEDVAGKMRITHRRDSFCGKISVCNNLVQYKIPFSLTQQHTMSPDSPLFEDDVEWFSAVCRVVNGLRRCRVGALGARPAAFGTVRYSEKLLERAGISVETLDLSELFGRAAAMADDAPEVTERVKAIVKYAPGKGVPAPVLVKMAKMGLVVDRWMAQSELDITAVQCWTAMEEYFGVVPCTVMSMLSNSLRSSACEVDVCGAIGMHALALASGTPSMLLDWNNNYGSDPDKCVCFHCSNVPKRALVSAKMDYQEIIAGTVGKEKTYGTVVGRIKPGPMTYARISTMDDDGVIASYIGEGRFTSDKLETFGGYAVTEIPGLQQLLDYICRNGFEHHVAMSQSLCARALHEAFDTYLDWHVYWHMAS